MFAATSLLLCEWPLCNTVPLLLWQVNTVETSLYPTHENLPQEVRPPAGPPPAVPPADHEARLVHSARFPFTQPGINTVQSVT